MKYCLDRDCGAEMSDLNTVFPKEVFHADYSEPNEHDKKKM